MAQKNKNKKREQSRETPAYAATETTEPVAAASLSQLIAGIVLLLIATGSSMMLVIASLSAMALPGCGEGSGCAEAANSVWGRLPGVGWPLSSVGAAYFTGLLVAFIVSKGRLPEALRMIVRLGTLGSVVLIVVMFTNGYVCKYCLAVHVANLAFWLLIEFIEPERRHVMRAAGALGGVFALGLAALVFIEHSTEQQVIADAEQQRQESTERILQASTDRKYAFTGRYHYGPEAAPMHIVMFSDYQCSDCYNIEQQVERLFRERDDVSLSIKHFPFCTDCNPNISRNLHPNACAAARAAEAAGLLGGNDAFWDMHFWLFSVKGGFDNAQLDAKIRQMGFDPSQFYSIMTGSQVERNILADINEATSLGLHFTPMIFVNGVQLRGVAAPNMLYNTIVDLAARNPQPDFDTTPPPAAVKYLEDWRQRHPMTMRPDFVARTLGAENPTLDIVMFADYLVKQTAEVDRIARRLVAQRDDVRYTIRHYPVNPACNPHVDVTLNDLSCEASRATEAAGQLAGNDAYWAMHDWVLRNQDGFSLDTIRQGAEAIGLDPDALVAMMSDQNVRLAVQEDMDAGGAMRFRSIPTCFINNKYVPRLYLEGDCIVDEIASEVLGTDVTEPN